MSAHELFESVELARGRLTALRARLEQEGPSPKPREIVSALGDLQTMLDELRSRYGLLRDILDRTNDVVFAKDGDGRYAMINPRGAATFGKSVAEILGTDDRALFEHADAERIMAVDRDVIATGEPRTREEICQVRGARITLLTTTTAWYDEGRRVRGVIGIAEDVTERRRRERESVVDRDRMRSMATKIVIEEERLRRLLAAELHDGLGQDIALARLKLSVLRGTAGTELRESLSGIEQLVEQADRSLRSITFQISPPSLHDLGLVAALQWIGEDLGSRYGIRVRIEDGDSPDVGDERTRVILFRAVREILINAATHARAREATVQLASQDDRVRIVVHDAGVGFDTADLDRRGSGLFGVREQLKYVDWNMEITSAPGHGTTVTLTSPVLEAAAPRSP